MQHLRSILFTFTNSTTSCNFVIVKLIHSNIHQIMILSQSYIGHSVKLIETFSLKKPAQQSPISIHLSVHWLWMMSVRKQSSSNNFKSHSLHLHHYLHHHLYHHLHHHSSSFNFATFKLFSLFFFEGIPKTPSDVGRHFT